MYENMTFETILKRMLDAVPNCFDKREGAVIYDALAPAAIELANMYVQLDVILNESFGDTATREYLVRRAAERGLAPMLATHAVLIGKFTPAGVSMPENSRFSCENLNYTMGAFKESDGTADYYYMTCETAGESGNRYLGRMIPIGYIDGLASAELIEIAVPGKDEEDTEVFRQRYFDSFDGQAYGGNIKDYKEKTASLDGVGGVKVYPVWNGGGTVKLVVIDSMFRVPSETLLSQVQTAMDPTRNAGEGLGLAPIGHVVTVEGVKSLAVDIVVSVSYANGWSWAAAGPYIEHIVDNYFQELAEMWADEENLIVRISQLESRILDCPGIVDITDTALNGRTANLILGENQIPVRGSVHE